MPSQIVNLFPCAIHSHGLLYLYFVSSFLSSNQQLHVVSYFLYNNIIPTSFPWLASSSVTCKTRGKQLLNPFFNFLQQLSKEGITIDNVETNDHHLVPDHRRSRLLQKLMFGIFSAGDMPEEPTWKTGPLYFFLLMVLFITCVY